MANGWMALRLALVRLRVILLAAGAVALAVSAESIARHCQRFLRGARAAGLTAAEAAPAEHFCPMHPSVVSATDGNCPLCGMRLSRRERTAPSRAAEVRVELDATRIRLGGIATAPVERRALQATLEAPALVEMDETRIARISSRFRGRVDELHVASAGVRVRKGQWLASLYVPELVAPGRELIKSKAAGSEQFGVIRQQLVVWGLTPGQIDRVLETRDPTHVEFAAPFDGILVAKGIALGDNVMEGAALFTVADLSRVWLVARVFEDEVGLLRPGTPVFASALADSSRTFEGTVSFIDPVADRESRTVAVRAELQNPLGTLRPGMALRARFAAPLGTPLAVPNSAVVDEGARTVVFKEVADATYQPVEVRAGARAQGMVPVLSGLAEGDKVVVQGAFLVDAEAELRGAGR